MSLCVLPPFSRFYPPSPITHTTYRASNHLPPSSVQQMIHRTSTAARPSLGPLSWTDMAKLGVRSALLFFGRRGRCERQRTL